MKSRKSARSLPAVKSAPAPAITTARKPSSFPASSSATISAPYISRSRAFFFSGRLKRRRRTPSSRDAMILSDMGGLHWRCAGYARTGTVSPIFHTIWDCARRGATRSERRHRHCGAGVHGRAFSASFSVDGAGSPPLRRTPRRPRTSRAPAQSGPKATRAELLRRQRIFPECARPLSKRLCSASL